MLWVHHVIVINRKLSKSLSNERLQHTKLISNEIVIQTGREMILLRATKAL